MVIISQYGIRLAIRQKRFSCMPRFGLYKWCCKFIEFNCRSHFSHWMYQKVKLWIFVRNLAKSGRLIAYGNGRDEFKSSLYYGRIKQKLPYIEFLCCKTSIYFVFSLFRTPKMFLIDFFYRKNNSNKNKTTFYPFYPSFVNSAFSYMFDASVFRCFLFTFISFSRKNMLIKSVSITSEKVCLIL